VPEPSLVPVNRITNAIQLLRGQKVLLDGTLAELYGVPPKALNQAVRRNRERFPDDFMFQLTSEEVARLRSQSVTLNKGRGAHHKYRPYAFTEQGVAMLSSVLKSPRAVRVNIEIVRAFVQLRQMLESNVALARQLDALEKRYDAQFRVVFLAIRELMAPPTPPPKRIGFKAEARGRVRSGREPGAPR
jgi:hypothetical protein